MKTVKGILLLCTGLLYLLKNAWHYSPLWINVLNDLLAVPAFLVVMEFLMQQIYGKRFRMGFVYITATVVIISVLFEGVVPFLSEKATADPVDVLLYAVGGTLFGILQLRTKERKVTSAKNL